MKANEFRAARQAITKAGETCEHWMDVPTATLDSWSRGEHRIPRVRARQMEWLQAYIHRKQEMQRLGIPECDWAQSHMPQAQLGPLDDVEEIQPQYDNHRRLFNEHQADCPVCQRRAAYWEQHPSPPFPLEGAFGPLTTILSRFYAWREARRRGRSAV